MKMMKVIVTQRVIMIMKKVIMMQRVIMMMKKVIVMQRVISDRGDNSDIDADGEEGADDSDYGAKW